MLIKGMRVNLPPSKQPSGASLPHLFDTPVQRNRNCASHRDTEGDGERNGKWFLRGLLFPSASSV